MDILTDSRHISRLEIVDTGRRRRWTDEEKLRIVEESFSAPRLVSATARRNGISNAQLFAWRKAYREGPRGAVTGFVSAIVAPDTPREVTVAEMPSSPPGDLPARPSGGRMVIVLSGGNRVIVGNDVDAGALRRVLDVLGQR